MVEFAADFLRGFLSGDLELTIFLNILAMGERERECGDFGFFLRMLCFCSVSLIASISCSIYSLTEVSCYTSF